MLIDKVLTIPLSLPPVSPVPPSVPACRIQGTLDVGADIMLMCSSEEGIPTPSYAWVKLESLPKLPHTAMQGIKPLAMGVPFCPTFAGKSTSIFGNVTVASAHPPPTLPLRVPPPTLVQFRACIHKASQSRSWSRVPVILFIMIYNAN